MDDLSMFHDGMANNGSVSLSVPSGITITIPNTTDNQNKKQYRKESLILNSCGFCGILILFAIFSANAIGAEVVASYGDVPISTVNGTNTYCWADNPISFTFITWLKVNGGITLALAIYMLISSFAAKKDKTCADCTAICGGCLYVFYILFKIAWTVTGWILWAQSVNRHCGQVGDRNILVDGGLGVLIVTSLGFTL